jgi:phage shock protein PspC (stress-responsive transcriptional regulator)
MGTPSGKAPRTVSCPVHTVDDMRQKLVRPRDNRMIAGVCAGLGRRFGISPNAMRLIFLLSCLLPGPQFVIYLALWIIMPNEDRYAATF